MDDQPCDPGARLVAALIEEHQHLRGYLQTWQQQVDERLRKIICLAAEPPIVLPSTAPNRISGRESRLGIASTSPLPHQVNADWESDTCATGSELPPLKSTGDSGARPISEPPSWLLEGMPQKVADAVEVVLQKHIPEGWAHELVQALYSGASDQIGKTDYLQVMNPSGIRSNHKSGTQAYELDDSDDPSDRSDFSPVVPKESALSKPSEADEAAKRKSLAMTQMYQKGGRVSQMISFKASESEFSSKTDPGKLRKQFRRKVLDNVSLTLILANTIYMAIEAQIRMDSVLARQDSPRWLWSVNVVFAAAFAMELTAKVLMVGRDFFRVDRGWNSFDLCLVVSSIADVVFEGLNISFLRGLRVVRAVRASRALQTIRHVQQLRLMVASLISSLPSLAWAFVLGFLLLYLKALLIMQGVEGHLRSCCFHDQKDEELVRMYGTLASAVLTLFMAISGGKDWGECVDPLRSVNTAYVFLFIFFVVFFVFGVVNILTAVFIEASQGIIDVDRDLVVLRHRGAQESTMQHLQAMFEQVDERKCGKVSKEQVEEIFRNKEFSALLKMIGLEFDQPHDVMQLLDFNEANEIEIGVFINGIMRMRGSAKVTDVAANARENQKLFKQMRGEIRNMSHKVDFVIAKSSERPHMNMATNSSVLAPAAMSVSGQSRQNRMGINNSAPGTAALSTTLD